MREEGLRLSGVMMRVVGLFLMMLLLVSFSLACSLASSG